MLSLASRRISFMSCLTRRSAMAAASPDGLAANPVAVDDPTPAAVPRRPVPLQLKAGLVIVVTIVLLGLLAPWIAPHPWDTISMRTRFQAPSLTYWLGTDEYGRDVLSRLLMGTRLSLAMGFGATLVSVVVGVPLGLAAGYFRGKVDEILMRVADVLM